MVSSNFGASKILVKLYPALSNNLHCKMNERLQCFGVRGDRLGVALPKDLESTT